MMWYDPYVCIELSLSTLVSTKLCIEMRAILRGTDLRLHEQIIIFRRFPKTYSISRPTNANFLPVFYLKEIYYCKWRVKVIKCVSLSIVSLNFPAKLSQNEWKIKMICWIYGFLVKILMFQSSEVTVISSNQLSNLITDCCFIFAARFSFEILSIHLMEHEK